METLGLTVDASFWAGRRVLLTGHTGFKGSWTALWLSSLGAEVTGFALEPESADGLFVKAGLAPKIDHRITDLRDIEAVTALVREVRPEIVLHMAAQPLVLRSYADPVETFATNAMGTVHLLDALRGSETVRTILVITSDKVYASSAAGVPHAEAGQLGGADPYSASKAMTEIATASFAASFFDRAGVAVATARAGNVIGGGDQGENRILPDAWRAVSAGQPLVLRNPAAVRPWQHVLDCVSGYLTYAERLDRRESLPRSLNFGPDEAGVSVEALVRLFFEAAGRKAEIRVEPRPDAVETHLLALDSSAARRALSWRPRLDVQSAIAWTADWYRRVEAGEHACAVTREQIETYARL